MIETDSIVETESIVADHPFMFAIKNNKSYLFLGSYKK